MSMPAPPGMLSPAAFPFPAPFPQNDVPFPAGSPYLVARLSGNLFTSTATIHVQNPTNPGDAICVLIGSYGTAAQPVSCTDTQGNVYSILGLSPGTVNGFHAIAVNANPVTAADTITITWPVGVRPLAVVVGCPDAAIQSPATSYLVPAATGNALATTAVTVTSAAALSQPALLLLALGANSNSGANLGLQNSSGSGAWNVAGTSFNSGDTQCMLAAWRIVPSVSAGQVIASAVAAAGITYVLRFTALIPETRFAPNRPAPDMPPGMLSPGAWQYAPLGNPMEGPATTRYNPGPNKWTETLPASPAVHAVVTLSTGKHLAATPVSQSALARAVTRVRTFTATAHPAGALVKSTRKILAASSHPAGALARSARKILAASSHPAGALRKAVTVTRKAAVTVAGTMGARKTLHRALAATVHAAGTVTRTTGKRLAATAGAAAAMTRSTGKRLAATARAAGAMTRTRGKILAARVTVIARVVMPNRIPLFRFGAAAWRWATGSVRNK